jgi:hypothetical protein
LNASASLEAAEIESLARTGEQADLHSTHDQLRRRMSNPTPGHQ